jgi:SPP1 gp7 family putative phage head morphogenesis protein
MKAATLRDAFVLLAKEKQASKALKKVAPPPPMPGLTPVDAVAWHEKRAPMLKTKADAMAEGAKKRAFWVSGLASLDAVGVVFDAIKQAVSLGETMEQFKQRASSALSNFSDNRVETIFRTNLQSAYSAGRYRKQTSKESMLLRPYWQFNAISDARTSLICNKCNGVTLKADNPWWNTHQPPLHHRCRSTIISLRKSQALDFVTASPPDTEEDANEGFGEPPDNEPWEPDASKYDPALWSAHKKKTALRSKGKAKASPKADEPIAEKLPPKGKAIEEQRPSTKAKPKAKEEAKNATKTKERKK